MNTKIANIALFIISAIVLISSVFLDAGIEVIVASSLLTGAFTMAIINDNITGKH